MDELPVLHPPRLEARRLPARGHFGKRLASLVKGRLGAGKRLPALDGDIDVLGIELDQPRTPARRSAAIIVVPDPPNGSRTMSRLLDELRIARSTSATGFIVGCRSLRLGLSKNQTSP